jgi:heme ABC exporter ATP-binding subunit CcmA
VSFDFDRVAIDDVSRHFGRRRALFRISLTIEAGEILGLLGPNGAGKSTLLAILATLLAPSSGTVRYGDRVAAEAGPELRARLGLLAHDLHLYPELTARENLQFFARLYGLPDVDAAVEAALSRAGLTSRADEVVTGFSRGMRQRLALERALIHEPRMLLLDEPFTGLDDASTAALVARLKGLREAGRLVVLTTHDLDVAEGLIDRAIVLREGRVVADEATRDHLRERYRTHLGQTDRIVTNVSS